MSSSDWTTLNSTVPAELILFGLFGGWILFSVSFRFELAMILVSLVILSQVKQILNGLLKLVEFLFIHWQRGAALIWIALFFLHKYIPFISQPNSIYFQNFFTLMYASGLLLLHSLFRSDWFWWMDLYLESILLFLAQLVVYLVSTNLGVSPVLSVGQQIGINCMLIVIVYFSVTKGKQDWEAKSEWWLHDSWYLDAQEKSLKRQKAEHKTNEDNDNDNE